MKTLSKRLTASDKEFIRYYVISRESRVKTVTDEAAAERLETDSAVCIAVSSSARNGVVGTAGAIELRPSAQSDPRIETMSPTLGLRSEYNPYSGELAAMASDYDALSKLKYR